jgi:preprotein translocase subunit YajC
MGNSSPYTTLILIALMVVAFYFLIIRPNKKRQQAQQATMNSLTPGTRVLLTSGFFGTLIEVGPKQAVLEVSPGVHLTVLKQAIARAVREGDEDPLDDDSLDREVEGLGSDDGYDDDLTPDTTHHQVSGTASTGLDSSESYQRSDSDPRPGTNTSPIKD